MRLLRNLRRGGEACDTHVHIDVTTCARIGMYRRQVLERVRVPLSRTPQNMGIRAGLHAPVPIAHTGSYAMTIFFIISALTPLRPSVSCVSHTENVSPDSRSSCRGIYVARLRTKTCRKRGMARASRALPRAVPASGRWDVP